MKNLLGVLFNGLRFNTGKLKASNCRVLADERYFIRKELECVPDVVLQLYVDKDGTCEGGVFDEAFGQYFPDTKDVCYEVLEIIHGMRIDGILE